MWFALACTFVTDEEWKARLDASCEQQTWYLDEDVDGFGADPVEACEAPGGALAEGGDCDDNNPDVHPGAAEVWYDGIDEACDGGDDDDQDGDGVPVGEDCMDGPDDPVPALEGDCEAPSSTPDPASVYPGAVDVPGDGVDADCSGTTDFDGDADGFSTCAGDCDDADASVNPDAAEVWYDGTDDDCDGNDDDQDGDGVGVGTDCDDEDPDRHPGATEVWYDDVDQDCDGNDDDQDGDGYDEVIDCDDLDPAVSPGEEEVWYDGVDQDCDGNDDDRDEDGYPHDVDCDDDAYAVNPAATEQCGDEVDDDCDGLLDTVDALDCTTFYVDGDGDGWGGELTECRCEATAALSAVTGDCDDSLASINPGAEELCATDADDNCSGEAQENGAPDCVGLWADVDLDGFGDPLGVACACEGAWGTAGNPDDCDDHDAAVLGPSTWYADADGDGWGDPAVVSSACDQPADTVDNADDCNDTDPTQRPDATEDCLTAYDDDCDGDTNDAGALNGTCWFFDGDRDGHGAGTCTMACFADGLRDTVDGTDCDDGDASVNPDAAEICDDHIDQDCDGSGLSCAIHGEKSVATSEGWYIGGSAGEAAGSSVDAAGGILAVGAPDADGGYGRVYVWPGLPVGTESLLDAPLVILGVDGHDRAGTRVRLLGDLDGDGIDDLGVSGTTSDLTASAGGAFAVISSGVRGVFGWQDSGLGVVADGPDQEVGVDFAAGGDLDGDGADDLVVGAPGAKGVGVYPGHLGGRRALSDASVWLDAEDGADRVGASLGAGQDLDGDGALDLVVGAPGAGGGDGRAYVLLGPVSTSNLGDADSAINGAAGMALGSTTTLADVDGDGAVDLLLGAPDTSGGAGALLVFAPLGSTDIGDASAMVLGDSGDALGTTVSAGDLDGDGFADLALGSRTSAYASNGGAALVFYSPVRGSIGATSAQAIRYGGSADDQAGAAVLCADDADGDGYGDLVMSAIGEDSGGSAAGSVYLFLGGGL